MRNAAAPRGLSFPLKAQFFALETPLLIRSMPLHTLVYTPFVFDKKENVMISSLLSIMIMLFILRTSHQFYC